jgi:tRNA nucleotidyltransferase (CCA-adding enzyme)
MKHVAAHWEQFPHGADIGVRGYGDTQEAAFEQAALAMMAVMIDPATVTPRVEITLTCEAPDAELLLVDWLNALLYEIATRKLLLGRFAVHINAGQLQGKAWGEAMQREKPAVGVEVKGATYTALRVQQAPNGTWLAQCVVDV